MATTIKSTAQAETTISSIALRHEAVASLARGWEPEYERRGSGDEMVEAMQVEGGWLRADNGGISAGPVDSMEAALGASATSEQPSETRQGAILTAIIVAHAKRTGRWTELDWDTGLSDLAYALREGGRISEGTLDEAETGYWERDGSFEARLLDGRLGKLLSAVRRGERSAELTAEAESLAQAERDAVESEAERAESLGRDAVEAATRGDFASAIECAEQAESAERQYGDAPVWGGLATAIRAALETADAPALRAIWRAWHDADSSHVDAGERDDAALVQRRCDAWLAGDGDGPTLPSDLTLSTW